MSSRLSLADLCRPIDYLSPSTVTSPLMTSSSPTPVHAGIKRPLAIDDQDEDVRIAVRALGDMRSSAVARARAPSAEEFAAAAAAKVHSRASSLSQATPLLTHSSTSTSTSVSSPVSSHASLASEPRLDENPSPSHLDPSSIDLSSEDFVSRVSHFPLVNTALKAYEHSKERSRVVKYGASLMESSVKTISRPVIERLPVGQLDEFACRQLDRLGYSKPTVPEEISIDEGLQPPPFSHHTYHDSPPSPIGSPSHTPNLAPSSTDENSAYNSLQTFHGRVYAAHDPQFNTTPNDKGQNDRQVASRSKWQTVLLEAGGISAAVSEESMKRLQYCLQWLQYATGRIDSQILILRSFIDSLSPQPSRQNEIQALVSLQTMRSLTDVRRDVVSTIRQVVDVISQYAGGALPEPARASVRAFILRLPAKWASANPDGGSAPTLLTPPPNPKYYRMESNPSAPVPPRIRRTAGRGTHPTAGAAAQTAQRILALATESLDMMRSVTAVFKESLDRAEAWVERLRVVGIQRQGQAALPPSPPSSSSAGPGTSEGEAGFSRDSHHDKNVPASPPSPTISNSSSMPSLTCLSLATQATTSPPTSVSSGLQECIRLENGDADAEGETETEDEGPRQQGLDASANAENKSNGIGPTDQRKGVVGMDCDG